MPRECHLELRDLRIAFLERDDETLLEVLKDTQVRAVPLGRAAQDRTLVVREAERGAAEVEAACLQLVLGAELLECSVGCLKVGVCGVEVGTRAGRAFE